MKFKLLLLSMLTVFSLSVSAQFFKPIPKPGSTLIGSATAANPLIQNNIRPVFGVTASVSDGATLAGGLGVGWQHNQWDAPSQAWVTQYSVSALAFLGSNGSQADFIGGLAFGFLNFISIGPGYDFTSKKFALLTGVQVHFN